MSGRSLKKRLRKERINKCLAILLHRFPQHILIEMSPKEIEELTFKLITEHHPFIDKYWEKWDDKKDNKENG